jgi:hypothetical protein
VGVRFQAEGASGAGLASFLDWIASPFEKNATAATAVLGVVAVAGKYSLEITLLEDKSH